MSDVSNIEIERRFLLDDGPDVAVMEAMPDFYVVEYEHGFLPGEVIRERVTRRNIEPPFKRTVKIGTGKARYEFEETVDEATFHLFLPLTQGRRLAAKRWCIRDTVLTEWYATQSGTSAPKKLKWEVTTVLGLARSLWLLEIETPTFCDGDPPFPVWLAPYVLREVTADARYEAYHLAVDGVPL